VNNCQRFLGSNFQTTYDFVPLGATALGHKLNVVDASELTVADWAAVRRVNRAYEARGIEAFWDELERLDRSGTNLKGLTSSRPSGWPRRFSRT
jgi:hypothetical protein